MADFRKVTWVTVQWQILLNLQIGGEFLLAHIGNLGNCPVADFRKSENWCGEFLKAHVGICPVADFRKSANWGDFYKHM